MQYESTHIYHRALELNQLSRHLLENLPVGFGYLADQLRRASSSVLLNFVEGYGKSTQKDSRRFFMYARGSANETAAIFDIAHLYDLISADLHRDSKDCCDQLARMLTKFRA